MYLLDTNIIIALLLKNDRVTKFIVGLFQSRFSISVVTRFEVFIGAHKHHEMTDEATEIYLDCYDNVNVDVDLVREAILLDRMNSKKMKFKDLIIAATAKFHNLTLITADKDFKKIEGLKTLIYKP